MSIVDIGANFVKGETQGNGAKQMRMQQGFTLIELMTVVAFIGILVAVALPLYDGYAKRAKMAEVILTANVCRDTITEAVQSPVGNTLPGANSWGCESLASVTNYIASITTTDTGKVMVTVQNIPGLSGVLTIVPLKSDGSPLANTDVGSRIYSWRCGDSDTDNTTIERNYLPASCRG